MVITLLLSTMAQGQSTQRRDSIVAAWQGWLSENNVGQSSIAVSHQGKLVYAGGKGTSPKEAIPLASLSKAITGACVARLISSGALSSSDTVGSIFASSSKVKVRNQLAAQVNVGQLLTHTSGLTPDATQKSMVGWLGSQTVRHTEASNVALARNPKSSGTYRYNNENYAILGAIIEERTGTSYETYCDREVLAPAGVSTGRLTKPWGAFGAWGGWEMSVVDYAKFIARFYGPKGLVGRNPTAFPNADLRRGAKYGTGSLFRSSGSSFNFWHAGRHCFSKGEAGAFFASWRGGWSVVVSYNDCLGDRQVGNLDEALANAALR